MLSQGEVGIWLSHLTAWHDIVESGLPFALVLEDDVVLSEDIKAVLRNVLIALDGEEWDIVALDVGVPGHTHVGVETTRPLISQRCVPPPVNCMRKVRSLLKTEWRLRPRVHRRRP